MSRTIRSETRQVVYKVFLRCLAESHAGKLLHNIADFYKRTSEMTGISVTSVRRIVKEGCSKNGVFKTPGKHRMGRPKIQLNDFDLCAIRQKVHYFYIVQKQVPTLRNLLPFLREELSYDGSRAHLRNILQAIGFSFKKYQPIRVALIEKTHIAAKREEYLRNIMHNKKLPKELQKNIIYVGECYIHTSYKLKKCWQPLDAKRPRCDMTKGKQHIIIHAGSKKGFVHNTFLCFVESHQQAVCHSKMNNLIFNGWVTEKLIPNLSEPSIIVLDNAPYHRVLQNKPPTNATPVNDIKLWLLENNIPFDHSLLKPSLLMLVKKNRIPPIYEIDQILGDHGHTVLRLPPYHCDLNPFELIWSRVKEKIVIQNIGDSDIKPIAEEAFHSITAEEWSQSCERVANIEKEYYETGQTLYETMDKLIKDLDDSDSSEYSTDSEYEAQFSGIEYLEENILD